MKLQQVNNTRPYNQRNTAYNSRNNRPSFGNFVTGLTTFLENNGFLAEFLTIDTTGMMLPRMGQGYMRNRKELGHLNYKAGREELVRELLSGPAFFYVPMAIITGSGLLNGKAARVEASVLDNFGALMEKTSVNMKNAAATKENFVNTVIEKAFDSQKYPKARNYVDELKKLMLQTIEEKPAQNGLWGKVQGYFAHNKEVKEAREKAVKTITKLNKANGKFIDCANAIMTEGKAHSISNFLKDMSNYLEDFTKKAGRTSLDSTAFVKSFHKTARNTRYITNISAIAALSAFLTIIPKLYQTGKDFPGTDGLVKNAAPASNNGKEAV